MSITLECHLIQWSLGALPEVYLAKAQGHRKAQTLLHKLFGSPGAWSAACPAESLWSDERNRSWFSLRRFG